MQSLPADSARTYSSRYSMTSAPPQTIKNYDEVTSLEYGLVKVPYELLNRKYRTTLKRLTRSKYVLSGICTDVLKGLPPVNEPIPMSKVADKLQLLAKKLHEFNTIFTESVNGEIESAKALQKRTEYLNKAINGNEQDMDFYSRQRVFRLIIDHLLRVGYFETAQKLAEKAGTEMFSNHEIFVVAKQVEESLKQKDLSVCLQWIADNRSKLHRLNSSFETEVHVQYAMELAKVGKRKEALEYVQKNFCALSGSQWAGNVMTLMTIIGAGHDFPGESYRKLASDDRWADLIEMFRVENARIFNISEQSSFSVALQLGLAAHKTPHCREDKNSRCIVCRELSDLAEGLPYSHISISRLICPYKGELINESNVPMMLPNGQIYCENAIHELSQEDEVYDPKAKKFFNLREVKRVFIL
uniref:Macrophage erythroblast attacher n=1 Tax=Panagrolaimus sp. JU765 TaxID=591449 RepID=A0AC34QM07_9BILA